jgi:hypothetical protein
VVLVNGMPSQEVGQGKSNLTQLRISMQIQAARPMFR